MLQTEYSFTLPCGYIDEQGNLHRQGVMRRATALDEIEPLRERSLLDRFSAIRRGPRFRKLAGESRQFRRSEPDERGVMRSTWIAERAAWP